MVADSRGVAAAIAELPAPDAAPALALYGVALTARRWRGRPTDPRRGALTQAASLLVAARPAAPLVRSAIARGHAAADTALLAGEDPEIALLSMAAEELRRAERAAERCGRRAPDLLVAGDTLLVSDSTGPALDWLLAALEPDVRAALRVEQADDPVSSAIAEGAAGLVLIGAETAALDGALVVSPAALHCAEMARSLGMPCYVLLPSGPEPSARTLADLGDLGETMLVLPTDLAGAVITDRGLYRSAMLARYLGDGDAPLDVIPLVG